MQTINLVFQLVCYYLAWFIAMRFAAENHGWYAAYSVLIISFVQLIWQYYVIKRTRALWLLVLLFSLIGFVVDTLLQQYHVIIFNGNPFENYSPPWMVMIWINFSILFYSVLKSYSKRYLLLSSLSLIFFPLAYIMGAKMGAAYFPMGYWSSGIIGIVWALLFPFCLFIYNTYEEKHG